MAKDASAPIEPDDVIKRSFTTVRRGVDPLEVQRYLLDLANQIRAGRERERELEGQLRDAEQRATPIDQLDPSRLTALLGEETARVLDAARAAAAEIRAKAEENVARLLREARDEAQHMRNEAETVLLRKTEEAEAEVAKIRESASGIREQADLDAEEVRAAARAFRDEAEAEAATLRREADEYATATRTQADLDAAEAQAKAEADAAEAVEAGRQEGREMVAEAQKVRQRMLDDLARRRKLLRQQIEQLQAGRDRLLAAYEVVRETLDVATDELQVALPEAKLAAETASLRASETDDATFAAEVEELSGDAGADADAEEASTEGHAPEGAPADQTESAGQAAADASAGGEDAAPEETAAEEPSGADEDGPSAEADSDEDAAADVDEAETASADAETGDTDTDTEGAAADVDEDAAAAAVAAEEALDGEAIEVPADAVEDEGDAPGAGAEAVADAGTETGLAPDPEEGRHSTSVKVVRTETGDRTTAIFARLRDEEVHGAAAMVGIEAGTGEPEEAGSADGGEAEEETDEGRRLLKARDAAIADLERNLGRKLKRDLSDEQNELLDAMRRQKGAPAAEGVLPAADDHVARYRSIALPVLADAAEAGAELVPGDDGGTAAPVADLAADLAGELVGPLRERLERCFAEADGDRDELAERIRACYREWKAQRVDQPASHAVVAAANRGALDALPEGTLVRWVVDDGDTPSPDCEDNALAPPMPKGEPFPTGHTAPPLHPSCRCMAVPAGDA